VAGFVRLHRTDVEIAVDVAVLGRLISRYFRTGAGSSSISFSRPTTLFVPISQIVSALPF
jgi:hypothetical protein